MKDVSENSQIAQQNAFKLNPEPLPKFVKFDQIQTYQKHLNRQQDMQIDCHLKCVPFSLNWNNLKIINMQIMSSSSSQININQFDDHLNYKFTPHNPTKKTSQLVQQHHNQFNINSSLQQYQNFITQNRNQIKMFQSCQNSKLNKILVRPRQELNCIQYITEFPLSSNCCMNTKYQLFFRLKKYNFMEIFKVLNFTEKHINCLDDELNKSINFGANLNTSNRFLKSKHSFIYRISHNISIIKIQISIIILQMQKYKDNKEVQQQSALSKNSANSPKIWKQIEIPIKNYEPDVQNHMTIIQKINGDIQFYLNEFQFMFSLGSNGVIYQQTPNTYRLKINSDGVIESLKIEQNQRLGRQPIHQEGCSQKKCLIF